jgi:hypothetical protein
MLNQVTRALASFIRPVAAHQSSADRDPAGSTYENLGSENPGQEETGSQGSTGEEQEQNSNPASASSEQAIAPRTPETELMEARKKAIGISQAWVGLVGALAEQKGNLGQKVGKWLGTGAYEKSITGSSRAARTKKGVILDKKAA